MWGGGHPHLRHVQVKTPDHGVRIPMNSANTGRSLREVGDEQGPTDLVAGTPSEGAEAAEGATGLRERGGGLQPRAGQLPAVCAPADGEGVVGPGAPGHGAAAQESAVPRPRIRTRALTSRRIHRRTLKEALVRELFRSDDYLGRKENVPLVGNLP